LVKRRGNLRTANTADVARFKTGCFHHGRQDFQGDRAEGKALGVEPSKAPIERLLEIWVWRFLPLQD
jgi:hypothetical protein